MRIAHTGTSLGNIEQFRGRNDPEALKAIAKEMEALFAHEMIKAMRKTTESPSGDNFGKDAYMSIFDMELSRLIAEKGLGLQEVFLRGIRSSASGERKKEEGKSPKPIYLHDAQKELSTPETLPLNGIISSPYGMRKHPVYGTYRFHHGIDIAASAGTEVYPMRYGRVTFSGIRPGYGNVVVIDHGDGFVSTYAHNKANLVKEGDEVTSVTPIAQVGGTGVATGPHLHFEVTHQGTHIDPACFIAKG